MILLDLSGVVVSAVIKAVTPNPKDLSLELVRTVTINRILQFKNKFSSYGDIIICADNSNYWRLDEYEYYKKNRKKSRAKSKVDWKLLSEYFSIVRGEIKESLPYMYLEVDRCEADDIIAVLGKFEHSLKPDAKKSELIMIVSSDKDMLQLQKFKNIDQFSTSAKKIISNDVSDYHLTEHIIRGDASDGVPNILSDDDVFMDDNKRQKCISAGFIADSLKMKSPEFICPNAESLKRYSRNRILIDFDYIPQERVDMIRAAYAEGVSNKPKLAMKKSRLYSYLIKHKMKRLLDELIKF